MTGARIAEAMLRQSGINDVRVICTPGKLTDHDNPMDKTVNLSEPVYHMNSVAAAVAAPECGHAVQRKQAYAWLENSGMAASMEHEKAKNALFWAAMTFDVAAIFCLTVH